MYKRMIQGLVAAVGMLILILDTKTAILGAQNAIELCIFSVIPSIFPFLVLSGILVSTIGGMKFKLLQPLRKILRIPSECISIFLIGILGGYPTGAQTVYNAWNQGQLSKENAQRMLAFCSNAGPSFIFGILASQFPKQWMLWLLWVIHILSAVFVAMIMPGKHLNNCKQYEKPSITLSQALKNAVVTMGLICGWIILFRVMLAFLDRWVLWIFPVAVHSSIYGIIELANGCISLSAISSVGLRFIISSGMLAFGGICVLMQTISVTGELGTRYYISGKLLQTLISIILSLITQSFLFSIEDKLNVHIDILIISALTITIFAFFLQKIKLRSRNLSLYGV